MLIHLRGATVMRSARTEAFWHSFCQHEGLEQTNYQTTHFRTLPAQADRLLTMMSIGAMRATMGTMYYFGEGREEPVPSVGGHAVLVDRQQRPRLIWRTTGLTIAPLSSVTDEFVWVTGEGNGERLDWLREVGDSFTSQSRMHGFDMHDNIETMFETLEVVWPRGVAHRIRQVAPYLDRGIALLRQLSQQRRMAVALEAILARIQTAVVTVGPTMAVGFTNLAAEALFRRGDGFRFRNGTLRTRWPADEQRLKSAVEAACSRVNRSGVLTNDIGRQRSMGNLVSIFRNDGQPPYQASVFPLKPSHAIHDLAHTCEAILFVEDPEQKPGPDQADLYSRAFRLTPAEARLAVHLASSGSLRDAADTLSVTYNTARSQLRAIFDKTGTHRQTELMRVLQTSYSLRVSLT
jgi:uncharacterized protein YhfF/DNA-binding CsgD family transcriptional regulator